MKKKLKKLNNILEKNEKGSYTVEMAMILPMLIVLIIFLIYISLFLYNQNILEQKIYMVANQFCQQHNVSNTQLEHNMSKQLDRLLKESFLSVEKYQYDIEIDFNKIAIKGKFKMKVPINSFITKMFGKKQWQYETRKEAAILNPVEFIRTFKKAEEVIDKVKEEKE